MIGIQLLVTECNRFLGCTDQQEVGKGKLLIAKNLRNCESQHEVMKNNVSYVKPVHFYSDQLDSPLKLAVVWSDFQAAMTDPPTPTSCSLLTSHTRTFCDYFVLQEQFLLFFRTTQFSC